jgi:hypothetical protein
MKQIYRGTTLPSNFTSPNREKVIVNTMRFVMEALISLLRYGHRAIQCHNAIHFTTKVVR